MKKNVSELITSKGYPVEEYTVQTADGFLLGVQRIPHGRDGQRDADKKPVYIQHGFIAAATDWVMNFADQSLGFVLADAGYDVWLGNTRGNKYSRRHVKYTPDMDEFWNYSFDEMGKFDLPAIIDYILKATGQEKLFYIGHSQGTTSAFALLSESPEYNEKIQLFAAMAPVIQLGHMTSVLKHLALFTKEFEILFHILGVREFAPSGPLTDTFSKLFCDSPARIVCAEAIFLICGTDYEQLNQTRLGVYTSHTPAGTSVKSLVHLAQTITSKKFNKFDYGRNNYKHYKQNTPPEYDVSRVTAPVALLWALNDKGATPVDVAILASKLNSLEANYQVPLPIFNHYDFAIAVNASTLVYDEVLRLFEEHS